jgi:hypothetical protein
LEDRGGSRVCMLAWVLSAEEGQAERDLDRYSRLTTPTLLTIVQYRLCSPCWHACCPSKPFQPPTLSTPQHEHVSPVDTLIRKLNTPPTQHRVGEDLESLPELPRNSQIRRNATLRLAERLGNRRGTHATCDSDNVLLKSTYGLLSPLPAGYRASRVSVRLPRHRPVEPYEADVSDLL